MSTESIVILAAVLLSIVIGSFSRVWGRAIGLLLVGGILGYGVYVYSNGRQLGFFGRALEAPYFYGIVGVLFVWEIVALGMALRARKVAKAQESACPACGSVNTTVTEGKSTCGNCHHTWA